MMLKHLNVNYRLREMECKGKEKGAYLIYILCKYVGLNQLLYYIFMLSLLLST